jgi:hypothetical protein
MLAWSLDLAKVDTKEARNVARMVRLVKPMLATDDLMVLRAHVPASMPMLSAELTDLIDSPLEVG